jgi:ubiquitin fusion degradation protein 1
MTNYNIDENVFNLDDIGHSLSRYQENINNTWLTAPRTIEFNFSCYPLIYYEIGDMEYLENSNKIILPNKILNDISKYNDIEYPLHFKINDSNILFTPSEFKHDIDSVYIPQHFLENLSIEIGSDIKLTLLNYKIKKGTKIKIKAHTSNFLEITDHKHYLERNLVKLYTTLTKGQTIIIPYMESNILIDVLECDPEETISIIDTDLEVDFEAPWDYVEPKPPPKEEDNFKNSFAKFKLGKFNFANNKKKSKEIEPEEEPVFGGGGGKKLGSK